MSMILITARFCYRLPERSVVEVGFSFPLLVLIQNVPESPVLFTMTQWTAGLGILEEFSLRHLFVLLLSFIRFAMFRLPDALLFCASIFLLQQHVSSTLSPPLFGLRGGTFASWSFDEPSSKMDWTELPAIELNVSSDGDSYEQSDLVIIGIAPNDVASEIEEDDGEEDSKDDAVTATLTGKAKDIDDSLDGALSHALAENNKKFKGGRSSGSTTPTIRMFGDNKTRRYMLLGLGKSGGADPVDLGRKVGKAVASAIQSEKGISSCTVVLPSKQFDQPTSLSALSSAFTEKLYADNRYRTGSNVKKVAESIDSVSLLFDGQDSTIENIVEAISHGRKISAGVYLAKDIVNAPHNVLNSLSLAETAQRIASESGGVVECKILEKDDCEERGMGAYLGVARGSETPPKFIHLIIKPRDGKVTRKVGIVGKGLLFDTGGYNIKTQQMHLMKFDCGGAAAVLGAARAIAALSPRGVETHIVVAACENMIDGRAVVPGDVLTASNGKTIEVENTDAEGRLTMADALVYCSEELECDKIIELSTLTGACMVALGNKVAGLFSKSDALVDELTTSSKVTGEKIWNMPMEKEYAESLKSKIADLKNLGGRYGGAITAALFLQNFVNKTPYAHIDIAGPVWDKDGATGFGARLVTEWVCNQC